MLPGRLAGLGEMNLQKGAIAPVQRSERVEGLAGSRAPGPARPSPRRKGKDRHLAGRQGLRSQAAGLLLPSLIPNGAINNVSSSHILDPGRGSKAIARHADAASEYAFPDSLVNLGIKPVFLQELPQGVVLRIELLCSLPVFGGRFLQPEIALRKLRSPLQ